MLVQDEDNNIFGGFISTNFNKSQDFFGTGDTFLFKLSVVVGDIERHRDCLPIHDEQHLLQLL